MIDRAASLRKMMETAAAELAKLESVPDPALYPDDTVLLWKRAYLHGLSRTFVRGQLVSEGPAEYVFVAIKAAGQWYSTARDFDTHVMTDDELRDHLADDNVIERWAVSEFVPLDEFEPKSPFEAPAIESGEQ